MLKFLAVFARVNLVTDPTLTNDLRLRVLAYLRGEAEPPTAEEMHEIVEQIRANRRSAATIAAAVPKSKRGKSAKLDDAARDAILNMDI